MGPTEVQLHITVAASPTGAISLETDLRMLKAALLYGDKAELYSLTSSAVVASLGLVTLSAKQRLNLLQQLAPELQTDAEDRETFIKGLRTYRNLINQKRLDKGELIFKTKFEAAMAVGWTRLSKDITKLASEAGADGLLQALKTGLVDFKMLDMEGTKGVSQFVDAVTSAVSDGTTYPLFDEQTAQLIRAGVEEGKFTPSPAAIVRGRHIGLAAQLFERLPLFEAATVLELMDIRRELSRPLVRFRSAIIKFSSDIKNTAWDKDFSFDAEQTFFREVEPAVLEIEDDIRSNNYLVELTKKLSENRVAVGSTLGFMVSQVNSLPVALSHAFGATAAGTAVVSAGVSAALALAEWRHKRLGAEQNHMFFYYGVKKRLGEWHPNQSQE